ncbi:MAG: alpha-L-fucosidase, partial [Lentisphaerae bacterium]|nr:alpha-L-fucosidase [Lentisphaerota bacterium]
MTTIPEPYGALPSPRQLNWHALEFYGFLHFTTNTFTDLEWGFGDESPTIFNPTDFDANHIVAVAEEAGMKGLILTCKHHDGFCLWPSKYTEHSVRNSVWRDGKGDVVRELADACARRGVKFGVYLSPWDRNHALYGTPEYVECYRNQLRELLTEYGPIFEVWHDGANGGDGYYGGANESRTIDKKTYYDWPTTWAIVRELQPDAVIFSDVGPDIRWVGNESGEGNETNWLTLNTEGWCPGFAVSAELNQGHEDGSSWLPPEVDVSIRPGWFYHAREDHRVRTVQQLLDIYYQSIGCSGSFLLNLPPDRRGRIHETDVERLRQMRRILDATFADDLAQGAAVSASNVRGPDEQFSPSNVLDGNSDTYWATDDGVTAAELILDLGGPTTFDRLLTREPIALGQRVKSWSVDVETDGTWTEIATATTIGYKRILRFPVTTASRVRIRIADAKACPLVSTVGLFLSPRFASDPRITRTIDGLVTVGAGEGIQVRYTLDGSTPSPESPFYTAPFSLPRGGTVTAAVYAADNPGV